MRATITVTADTLEEARVEARRKLNAFYGSDNLYEATLDDEEAEWTHQGWRCTFVAEQTAIYGMGIQRGSEVVA